MQGVLAENMGKVLAQNTDKLTYVQVNNILMLTLTFNN